MHHIYHTEGLILGSKNFGETSRYYYIFTRDLGMIYASAQGVRKMSSKLRFVLQDFAYVKIDLVQGKEFWRVTSASKTNLLGDITKTPQNLAVFDNIARLLRRLLAGVEPNPELFADVLSGLEILETLKTDADLRNAEAVLVLRILNNLGYIGGGEQVQNLVSSPLDIPLLLEMQNSRSMILSLINKALRETHL